MGVAIVATHNAWSGAFTWFDLDKQCCGCHAYIDATFACARKGSTHSHTLTTLQMEGVFRRFPATPPATRARRCEGAWTAQTEGAGSPTQTVIRKTRSRQIALQVRCPTLRHSASTFIPLLTILQRRRHDEDELASSAHPPLPHPGLLNANRRCLATPSTHAICC